MVRYLRKNGVQIAIFTDHDTVRWDYGFFPARYLIGRLTGWVIGQNRRFISMIWRIV